MIWSTDKKELTELGKEHLAKFCETNQLSIPPVVITPKDEWLFSVCAYYRPDICKWTSPGINICLEKCQVPCVAAHFRNWSWPGSTTDREPFGVLAHELGHHVDWITSDSKGPYYGDYSIKLREKSGESPITKYCDNDAEWFAEIFRLFITNHALLKLIRPRTYELLAERWKPISNENWESVLGENVPQRVINSLRKKVLPICFNPAPLL